jgi:hypothetical protein
MNNIYGQSNRNCGCREDSTRPIQRTQPSQYMQEQNEECRHNQHEECRHEQNNECRQVAGTVFRINIPAGAEINILNLVELASPSGICLILRLPFLAGECGQDHSHC